MFDFFVMLRSIFMKLYTIVWNTRGYALVKVFYSVKVYTIHMLLKIQGYHFSDTL